LCNDLDLQVRDVGERFNGQLEIRADAVGRNGAGDDEHRQPFPDAELNE
jgi:hypothetical protein